MPKRRSVLAAALPAAASVALLLGGALPASAEAPAPTNDDAVVASAVANSAAGSPAPEAVEGSTAVTSESADVDIEVPLDPSSGLVVDPERGPELTIGLPGPDAQIGTAVDGNVVYEEVAPDADLVARPTDDGVQALLVIDGPRAPTTYRFPIDVGGEAADLRLRPDGSVEVRRPGQQEVDGLILPAWATGADGASVPTRFVIDGSTLTQVVEHAGAAYPVVADPRTCGVVTCTYYFNKRTTKDLSGATKAAAVCGLLLKFPIATAGCAASAGVVAYQADRARNRGMCLKIKYTKHAAVWWPDIYRGKHCR
jgi:hypothetical protein